MKNQILELKEYLKETAIEQKEAKRGRKPSYHAENCRSNAYECASRVQFVKVNVTAALNLYHEVRGSDHRHNIRPEIAYQYGNAYTNFKSIFFPGV